MVKIQKNELCTHCTVSSIHGTSVYLPPEYLRHKILSPAVDVYSYGIVLLEMATGKRAYDGKRLLVDLVEEETHLMSMGKLDHSLKDPRLTDDTQNDLKIWYELLIQLGLNCSHKMKKKRLDMELVLRRFAEFRTNNPNCISTGGNINFITLSSRGSAGTAKTLAETQGHGRMNYHETGGEKAIASGFPGSAQNNKANINGCLLPLHQSHLPKVSDLIQNFNSAMSIEEEPELKYNGLDQSEQQHNLDNHQVKASDQQLVDAMIPLLTELGVVTEQK